MYILQIHQYFTHVMIKHPSVIWWWLDPAGCLYTYTGTERHYCFKEIPTLNAKLPIYNVSRQCLANFPGIANMVEEEQASLCCGHQVLKHVIVKIEDQVIQYRSRQHPPNNIINTEFFRTVKKTLAVFSMRSVLQNQCWPMAKKARIITNDNNHDIVSRCFNVDICMYHISIIYSQSHKQLAFFRQVKNSALCASASLITSWWPIHRFPKANLADIVEITQIKI